MGLDLLYDFTMYCFFDEYNPGIVLILQLLGCIIYYNNVSKNITYRIVPMFKRLLCGAALLAAANISNAGVITQDFTVNNQNTDISEVISFDLFDDLGGTLILESVSFSLNALVNGSAAIENRNVGSTVINATLSADVLLSDAISGSLISLAPTVSQMSSVAGFDGVVDFGGTSGLIFLNMNANESGQFMLVDMMSLADYIGVGTSTLDFIVNATSDVIGGGNLTSELVTNAGASISVVYTFSEDLVPSVVSEPAYFALLGMGILAFGRFKRRTK